MRTQSQRWGMVLGSTGALLLIGAAVMAGTVLPASKELPAGQNQTRQLSGTAKVLLNSIELGLGNLKDAVRKDLPATGEQTTAVLATSGHQAAVADARTLVVDGTAAGVTHQTYAVDRDSLEASRAHPDSWQVPAHQGLTVSWPSDAQPKDYVRWLNATGSATPMTYVREETLAGLKTYVYEVHSEPAVITDNLVRARLPWAMPSRTLTQLAQDLPLTADERSRLAAALPRTNEMTDIDYTYELSATFWVEPATGQIIKAERHEIQRVGPIQDDKPVAVVPVYDVSLGYTDASVREAAAEALHAKNRMTLYAIGVPAVAVLGGACVIAGIGVFVSDRRKRRGSAS